MNIQTPIKSIAAGLTDKHRLRWLELKNGLLGQFPTVTIQLPPDDLVDQMVIGCQPAQLLELLIYLKEKAGFDFLTDLTATDELPREPRFDVVYQLMSTQGLVRLRVKCKADQLLPSIVPHFPAADWAEREVFDMFGIIFENHPDLRRILMHESWEGFPLRKDYPLKGYQVITQAMRPNPERFHES